MPAAPRLVFERSLWSSGMSSLAGIDEAGRGALAGPVVAAVVYCDNPKSVNRIRRHTSAALIRDSKTLSYAQRATARDLIRSTFQHYAVGTVSSQEIDLFGIAAANRIAMERALHQLTHAPEFLLIDAFTIDSSIPQWGIIDGDAKSVLGDIAKNLSGAAAVH